MTKMTTGEKIAKQLEKNGFVASKGCDNAIRCACQRMAKRGTLVKRDDGWYPVSAIVEVIESTPVVEEGPDLTVEITAANVEVKDLEEILAEQENEEPYEVEERGGWYVSLNGHEAGPYESYIKATKANRDFQRELQAKIRADKPKVEEIEDLTEEVEEIQDPWPTPDWVKEESDKVLHEIDPEETSPVTPAAKKARTRRYRRPTQEIAEQIKDALATGPKTTRELAQLAGAMVRDTLFAIDYLNYNVQAVRNVGFLRRAKWEYDPTVVGPAPKPEGAEEPKSE